MNYEEMTNEQLEKFIENKSKRLELSTLGFIHNIDVEHTVEKMMKAIFILEKRGK